MIKKAGGLFLIRLTFLATIQPVTTGSTSKNSRARGCQKFVKNKIILKILISNLKKRVNQGLFFSKFDRL